MPQLCKFVGGGSVKESYSVRSWGKRKVPSFPQFIIIFALSIACKQRNKIYKSFSLTEFALNTWFKSTDWTSTLDKQRICVNTQLKSSKKQLKLSVCVPKSNSNNRYAITCDVIAYHLVHFVSIRLIINKCQSGIDFIFTSERAIYSSFMKISVPSPVFAEKHLDESETLQSLHAQMSTRG